MTWDAFHRRGEVLQTVIAEADRRRDGVLPMQLPGVAETFGDEATLVGALHLRWHTRLTGTIERELAEDPSDPERAVVTGWRQAAAHAPGIRALLDAQAAAPASEDVREVLTKAVRKEWAMLAAMAAKAAPADPRAVALGHAIEEQARAGLPAAPGGAHRAEPQAPTVRCSRPASLVSRIKGRLAA